MARSPLFDSSLQRLIDEAADRHGIDRELAHTVAQMESNYNPQARSPVGAMGVMQLMPTTAQSLGVENPWDPAQNIEGGVKYLAQLSQRYDNDPRRVLAAYNAGPGAVDKAGGVPQYRETLNYVATGMQKLQNAAPQIAGFEPLESLKPEAKLEIAGFEPLAEAKPPEPSPISKAGRAFWESVGGPALVDIAGGLTGTPERLERAKQALAGVAQGFAQEPGRVLGELARTGQAMLNLDVPGTAYHLAGAVPLLGAPAQQIAQDLASGDPARAVGHTAGFVAPFVAGPAARTATRTASTAAELTGAAVRAATPDVVQGAAKAAAGAAISAPLPGPLKYIVGANLTRPGLTQMMQGVKTGIAAARNLPVEQAAAEAAARTAAEAAADASRARQIGAYETWERMTAPPAQRALPPASSIPQPAVGTYAEAQRLKALGPEALVEPAAAPVAPVEAPVAPPAAAPPAAAPPAPTLDELSHSLAGKPFAKLNAAAQAQVQLIQNRIQEGAAIETARAPEALPVAPRAAVPEPALAPDLLAPIASAPEALAPVPETPPAAPPAPRPSFAEAARAKKVDALFETMTRNKIPSAMVEQFGPDEWRIVADYAGVNPPSETSIGQLKQRLADYEAGQNIPVTGTMTPAEAEAAFSQARAAQAGTQAPRRARRAAAKK